MAQVNQCLKRTFTIFNILFAVIGAVIIALTLMVQIITSTSGEHLEGRLAGLILLYAVGIITMVIAMMGAYGAHKEKKGFLVAFLVCMVLGSLMMLRSAVNTTMARPQMEDLLKKSFHSMLPLNEASDEVKEMAETLQKGLHCCGLFSYEDWNNEIPSSCKCSHQDQVEGLCRTLSDKTLLQQEVIYTKPCFPFILHYALLLFDIVIGVSFTLGALALLGLVLSSIIIHQMRQTDRPTILLSVPAIFTPQPPKYQELHNPPHY